MHYYVKYEQLLSFEVKSKMKYLFLTIFFILFANLSIPNNKTTYDTLDINNQHKTSSAADTSRTEANTVSVKESFASILYQLQILITEQEYIIKIYRKTIIGLIIAVIILAVILFLNLKKQFYFHRFPYYRQKKGYHPGLVCLQMISAYFGKRISYKKIKKASKLKGVQNVFSVGDLINTAENIGIQIKVVKTDINRLLSGICLPVILYLPNHMVIVHKITNEFVFVADPFYGFIKLKIFYFLSIWYSASIDQNGIAFLVKPYANFKGRARRIQKALTADYSAIKQLDKKERDTILCEI